MTKEFAGQAEYRRRLEALCEDIAQIIDGGVTSQRVMTVIDASNANSHIFHGVKRFSSISGIIEKGILPLSPEGGFVSYWATGFKIFANTLDQKPLRFYDTPFFHYGYSKNTATGEHSMAIAITNPRLLDESVIVPSDNVVAIGRAVSSDSMLLLVVEGPNAKVTQQSMFELLENACINGYKSGTEVFTRIT